MDAPALAVGEGGDLVVAWMDRRDAGVGSRVWWTQSAKGAFQEEAGVCEASLGDRRHPAVARGADGVWRIAWTDERDTRPVIFVRPLAGPERRLSAADEGRVGFARLASAGGTAVAVYESEVPEREPRVLLRRLP